MIRRWLLHTESLNTGRLAGEAPLGRFWTRRAAIRAARFVGKHIQDVVVDGRTGRVVYRVVPNDEVTIAAPFDPNYRGTVNRYAAEHFWAERGWVIVP